MSHLASELSPAILVTGGAGFIGSHLVDRLLADKHRVFIIDDMSTGNSANINYKAQINYSPIQHINFLGEKFYKQLGPVSTIYHLAACPRIQPSFKHPAHSYDVNSTGTVQVLELARKLKAKVIYAGSSSAYHDPKLSPYAYTKWLGEEHCILYRKLFGVPTYIARFFNVYGPRQVGSGDYATVIGIFERQYREKQPLTVVGSGQQRRDMTYVEDIVDGLLKLGSYEDDETTIFNFGSGTNWSINEIVQMFGSKEVIYLPERPGEYPVTLADISLSQTRLGWTPKHNLQDYVKKIVGIVDQLYDTPTKG